MTNSINKNNEPIVFQAYFKVSSKNYMPTLVHQIGSYKLLEDLLSSPDLELITDQDIYYPKGHHIGFRAESQNNVEVFTLDYSFGCSNTLCKDMEDSFIIFCKISDDGVDHDTDYHIFISKGNYHRNHEIVERLRNGGLDQNIMDLIGNEKALIEDMNFARDAEKRIKASRVVNAFYAFNILPDGQGGYRPKMITQWCNNIKLDQLLSSPSCFVKFNDLVNPSQLSLTLMTKGRSSLCGDIKIEHNYGLCLISDKENSVTCKEDCLLVFHHPESSTFFIVVSKGRFEECGSLLKRFRTGDLKSEFGHFFVDTPAFDPSNCIKWLEEEKRWREFPGEETEMSPILSDHR